MSDRTIMDGLVINERGKPHAARCGAIACPCYREAALAFMLRVDEVREEVADAIYTAEGAGAWDTDGGHWDDTAKLVDLVLDALNAELKKAIE